MVAGTRPIVTFYVHCLFLCILPFFYFPFRYFLSFSLLSFHLPLFLSSLFSFFLSPCTSLLRSFLYLFAFEFIISILSSDLKEYIKFLILGRS